MDTKDLLILFLILTIAGLSVLLWFKRCHKNDIRCPVCGSSNVYRDKDIYVCLDCTHKFEK